MTKICSFRRGGRWMAALCSLALLAIPNACYSTATRRVLTAIPAGGFYSDEEIARPQGARRINASGVVPGPSPNVCAFYRGTIQRNSVPNPDPMNRGRCS
jgi:hypothetical protein